MLFPHIALSRKHQGVSICNGFSHCIFIKLSNNAIIICYNPCLFAYLVKNWCSKFHWPHYSSVSLLRWDLKIFEMLVKVKEYIFMINKNMYICTSYVLIDFNEHSGNLYPTPPALILGWLFSLLILQALINLLLSTSLQVTSC